MKRHAFTLSSTDLMQRKALWLSRQQLTERAFTLEDTQEKESLLSRPSHDNAQEILRNIFSNIEEFPIFIKNQPVNIGLEEIEKL